VSPDRPVLRTLLWLQVELRVNVLGAVMEATGLLWPYSQALSAFVEDKCASFVSYGCPGSLPDTTIVVLLDERILGDSS
jgi:hypothetical protein